MSSTTNLTRREFWTSAGALAWSSTSVATQASRPGLESTFLMDLSATIQPPQELGNTPEGDRQIYIATGGTFDGPRLRGTILAGGGDWGRVRPDGSFMLDVRGTLETDDGALIYVTYAGIAYRQPNGTMYFRVTPYFETASEQYGWLNRVVAVGIGHDDDDPARVTYSIYQIL